MPARRFFALYNAMERIKTEDQMEALETAAVAIADSKYFKDRWDRLEQRLTKLSGIIEAEPEPVYDNPETMAQKVAWMKRHASLARKVMYGR